MNESVSTRIVAIHGFLGQPDDWEAIKRQLHRAAPTVDFQTVELFSKLPNPKESSPKEWATRFNRTQKNRHVERNILMGYSLGGRLALQAIYDKPGLWDEVILISAHPGFHSVSALIQQQKLERKKSDRAWADRFLTLPWQEVLNLWNTQPVFAHSKEPLRQESRLSREALAAALVNWSLAEYDFAPESLIALKPKLHWFTGEHDSKYRHLFEDLQASGFIDNVNVVRDAGHRIIFDNPEEFARQLVYKLDLL